MENTHTHDSSDNEQKWVYDHEFRNSNFHQQQIKRAMVHAILFY